MSDELELLRAVLDGPVQLPADARIFPKCEAIIARRAAVDAVLPALLDVADLSIQVLDDEGFVTDAPSRAFVKLCVSCGVEAESVFEAVPHGIGCPVAHLHKAIRGHLGEA